MKGIDREATQSCNFYDAESVVMYDGREWLAGKDWYRRKEELAARSKGFCEAKDYPLPEGKYCLGLGQHPHHVIPRGEKHDDRLENLLHVCAEHHRTFHPEKKARFGHAIHKTLRPGEAACLSCGRFLSYCGKPFSAELRCRKCGAVNIYDNSQQPKALKT